MTRPTRPDLSGEMLVSSAVAPRDAHLDAIVFPGGVQASSIFVIPLESVLECVELTPERSAAAHRRDCIDARGEVFAGLDGVGGLTIPGDGKVALILDAANLLRRTAGLESRSLNDAATRPASGPLLPRTSRTEEIHDAH